MRKAVITYLPWLLEAAIFFAAVRIRAEQPAAGQLQFFFGASWRARMLLVVLITCAVGLGIGALGRLAGFWKPLEPDATTAPLMLTPTLAAPAWATPRSDGL